MYWPASDKVEQNIPASLLIREGEETTHEHEVTEDEHINEKKKRKKKRKSKKLMQKVVQDMKW